MVYSNLFLASQIEEIDERLLLFLNGFHNEFFDSLMWIVSGKLTWIPFYIILTYMVMRRSDWKSGVKCLLFIAIIITLADQTCASILRPMAMRLRPSSEQNPISNLVHIVNGYRGGRYGFPSCHAANTFALALFLSMYFRRRWFSLLITGWAAMVSYSRIYLGVHYPGDLLCGAAVGSMYAFMLYGIFRIRIVDMQRYSKLTGAFISHYGIRLLRPIAICAILLKPANCAAQTDSTIVIPADTATAIYNIYNKVNNADSIETASHATADSITLAARQNKNPYKFNAKQLIIPGALIGVGFFGLHNQWLIHQNKSLREELQENIDKRFTIDDFTQYVPMASTYALRLCGVKGKHGYADMTIILGTAYALMGISVNALKAITKVQRPDESSYNSFPSGHTATAFMGAELLRREYWNVSPWIGVAGYAVAAGTGFFRMYNNRHWLTDVIAGAGFGILSVQAAYWLYPTITKTFFKKRYLKNTFISPYYSKQEKGLTCAITF